MDFMGHMKPYSEDLRIRIIRAVEESMSKSAAARPFGVSLSSVKRYMRLTSREASLAPEKGGGKPLKANETTRKLLEEDVEERPAATILERCRVLRSATAKSLSTYTLRRLLKRLGFSQETERGGDGTGRMA
jgi:transposase